MLAWSVRVAQASGQFVETMVSTEDLKIAEIAQACGAKAVSYTHLRAHET